MFWSMTRRAKRVREFSLNDVDDVGVPTLWPLSCMFIDDDDNNNNNNINNNKQ